VALGAAMRSGADDAALWALISLGIREKRSHHPSTLLERKPFSMSETGG
jgi:hypothetical protein